MFARYVLIASLMVGLGASAFAAQEPNVTVTVKGILHEDKNGFFIQADNAVYDLVFDENSRADMHKFHAALKGDWVKVSGALRVEEVANAKPSLVVYANDIGRFRPETVVQTTTVAEPVVVERPVIVREHYVEHNRGINLPGVHINW